MRRISIFLISAVLLTGCTDSGEPSHLAQSVWRFERIDGQRPTSGDAGITFAKNRIDIEIGCSTLDGPWRVDADRLVAGPLDQSEVTCTDASWNEASAVNALLVATPRLSVNGDRMTLQSSGHTAELVRVETENITG